MSKVRRVYVEKKDAYAVRAKELHAEIKSYLGISAVDKVRVLIRYDIENISDDVYKRAVQTVFSEPPVDDVYEENFEMGMEKYFPLNSFRDSSTREQTLQYSVSSLSKRMSSR